MANSEHVPAAPIRFSIVWITRPLFGILMAVIAIAALFYDPLWFSGLTLLMGVFAAREWHRMVRDPAVADQPLHIQTIITIVTIAAAMALLLMRLPVAAFVLLVIGTVGSFVAALRRHDNPAWHAVGVIYLGLPAMALVALRSLTAQGALIVLGLFLIVWTTDTAALIFGKLIGGARIAPRLSPGKTWAGTLGGSVCAALVFGLYIGFFGFNMLLAMAFALVFSITCHAGDLLESAIKRHFGRKDSGSLIPGHGGVLDRMDSTFAASVVLALLVFWLHLNPMFGGRA